MGACTRTGIDDGCEPPDSVKYILGPDARILLPVDESDRITMITFFTKLSGGLERGRPVVLELPVEAQLAEDAGPVRARLRCF